MVEVGVAGRVPADPVEVELVGTSLLVVITARFETDKTEFVAPSHIPALAATHLQQLVALIDSMLAPSAHNTVFMLRKGGSVGRESFPKICLAIVAVGARVPLVRST